MSTCGFYSILGYWPCKGLSFHFSSFTDFILDLNMYFRALAFSEVDLSCLISNSAIVSSLLNLVAFLVICGFGSFMFRQLLWISPFFVLQIMIKCYCCCFECCFYLNLAPSSIFSWKVQPFHIWVCVFLCQSSSVLRFSSL